MKRREAKEFSKVCEPDLEPHFPATTKWSKDFLLITFHKSNQMVIFSGKDLRRLKEFVDLALRNTEKGK